MGHSNTSQVKVTDLDNLSLMGKKIIDVLVQFGPVRSKRIGILIGTSRRVVEKTISNELKSIVRKDEKRRFILNYVYDKKNFDSSSNRIESDKNAKDLEIIKTYEALAKRIGMSDAIRASLADWHRTMKRYPKAREIYASFDNKIDGLKHIASTWIHQKQPDQAIRIYDRLTKLAPDQLSEWRQAVAEIYSSIGEHDKAIEVYRELITLAPSQAGKWHWTIGGIYEDTNKDKLVTYTLVSGLKRPGKRIEGLKKFLKK